MPPDGKPETIRFFFLNYAPYSRSCVPPSVPHIDTAVSVHLINLACTNSQQILTGFQRNFIGTFSIIATVDVYIASMLWLVDFSLSYGPLIKPCIRSCPHKISATNGNVLSIFSRVFEVLYRNI